MIRTGESCSTRRESTFNATLTTINVTWTDRRLNTGFRVEMPATDPLSHGTARCSSF